MFLFVFSSTSFAPTQAVHRFLRLRETAIQRRIDLAIKEKKLTVWSLDRMLEEVGSEMIDAEREKRKVLRDKRNELKHAHTKAERHAHTARYRREAQAAMQAPTMTIQTPEMDSPSILGSVQQREKRVNVPRSEERRRKRN